MPVPQRFTPPFSSVRRHIALGVTDLGRSRALYADTLGLVLEDADQDALYLRGVERTASAAVMV